MKENKQENENNETKIFGAANQVSESHIFRNILVGTLVAIALGIGAVMILGTIFAQACATNSTH